MAIKHVEVGSETVSFVKATPWKEVDLKGEWMVSLKIDGVRVFKFDSGWYSRAGKPLYNLDHIEAPTGGSYEVYNTNWEDSVSLVRTSVNGSPCPSKCLYRLSTDPSVIDERLVVCIATDPTVEEIQTWLTRWLAEGYEGLMLSSLDGKKILKVKPKDTADVFITGYVEGKGKHAGRLGLFTTNHGNVGTGLTDADREDFWARREEMVGQLIEVEFMELTPAGKFRHPRFVRVRTDKNEESIPSR